MLDDPAQVLRESIRVARRGGTVSAIVCFCRSGNLPHHHGRYLGENDNRIDVLHLEFTRAFRVSVRPRMLGVDHSVLVADVFSDFMESGLSDIEVNGHLATVSPSDARFDRQEAGRYALAQSREDLSKLERIRQRHGEELEASGFTRASFDELIALKRERHAYMAEDPARVLDMGEVISKPLMIIKGTVPEEPGRTGQ